MTLFGSYRDLMALPFVLGAFLVACAPESDKPRHQTLEFRQVPVPSVTGQGRVTSPGFAPRPNPVTSGRALPIEVETRSLEHIQRPQGLPQPPPPVTGLSGGGQPTTPHLRARIGSVSLTPKSTPDQFDVTIQVSSQVLNFHFERRSLGTLVESHFEGYVLTIDCRDLHCTQAYLHLREVGTQQVAEIRYQSSVEFLQGTAPQTAAPTVQVPTPIDPTRATDPQALVQQFGTLPATRETVVIVPSHPEESARQIEIITVEPPQADQGPGIAETPPPQSEGTAALPVEEDTPEELAIPLPPPAPPPPPPIRYQAEQEIAPQSPRRSEPAPAAPAPAPTPREEPRRTPPAPVPAPSPAPAPAAPAPRPAPQGSPGTPPATAQVTPPAPPTVVTPPTASQPTAPVAAPQVAATPAPVAAPTPPANLRNGICSIAGHLIPAVNGSCSSGMLRTGCGSGQVGCLAVYGASGARQVCVPDTAESTRLCWNKVVAQDQVAAAVAHLSRDRRTYAHLRRGVIEFCRGLQDQPYENCLLQASPLFVEHRRVEHARATQQPTAPPTPALPPAPAPAPAPIATVPPTQQQATTPPGSAPAPAQPLPTPPLHRPPPPEEQRPAPVAPATTPATPTSAIVTAPPTPPAPATPPPAATPTTTPTATVRLVSDPFVAFGLAAQIPDRLLDSRRPEREGINLDTAFRIVPPHEQQPAEPSHRLFVLANALITQRIPIYLNACNIFLRTALSLTGYTHGRNYLANQYRMVFQNNNQGLRDWDEFPRPGNTYTAIRRIILDRLEKLPDGYSMILQVVRNSPNGHVAIIAKEQGQLYILDSSYGSRPPQRRAVRAQNLLLERNVRYFIYTEPTVHQSISSPGS